MDYIEQIQKFNELLPQSSISVYGISLWYGIMFLFQKESWPKQMSIPMRTVCEQCKLSRFKATKERERLCRLGLISYERRSGSLHGVYGVLPPSEKMLLLLETSLSPVATSLLPSATSLSPSATTPEAKTPDLLPADTTLLLSATSLLPPATTPDGAIYNNINNKYISKRDNNKKNNKDKESVREKEKGTKVYKVSPKKKSSLFNPDKWLATVESPWQELMAQWFEYKRARKESYDTEMGARKCLTMLRNLSGNDATIAQQIIDKSMASNYAGLFPLSKSYGSPASSASSRTDTPQYGQHIGQIKQPEDEEKRQRILEKFRSMGNGSGSRNNGNPDKNK